MHSRRWAAGRSAAVGCLASSVLLVLRGESPPRSRRPSPPRCVRPSAEPRCASPPPSAPLRPAGTPTTRSATAWKYSNATGWASGYAPGRPLAHVPDHRQRLVAAARDLASGGHRRGAGHAATRSTSAPSSSRPTRAGSSSPATARFRGQGASRRRSPRPPGTIPRSGRCCRGRRRLQRDHRQPHEVTAAVVGGRSRRPGESAADRPLSRGHDRPGLRARRREHVPYRLLRRRDRGGGAQDHVVGLRAGVHVGARPGVGHPRASRPPTARLAMTCSCRRRAVSPIAISPICRRTWCRTGTSATRRSPTRRATRRRRPSRPRG